MIRKFILILIYLLVYSLVFLNPYQNAFAKTRAHHNKKTAHVKSVKGASIAPEVPVKNEFTIAAYGDSMVDTMGEALDYLGADLHAKYPKIVFNLYNYGIGGQNVQQGLDRFGDKFSYQTRNYPAISDIHPDAIILGSFSYNPFNPYDRNRHWLTFAKLVEKAKAVTPNVFILAEIAPLGINFGKGPHGVNWPSEMTTTQSREINEQLENAVALSSALHVGLINAYHVTKAQADTGSSPYTNTDDGIHPSIAGHTLVAGLIMKGLHSVFFTTKP